MNNNYKFVDGYCKVIYEVTDPIRIIPERNQHIIVRDKEYSIYRVDEIINFNKK